MVNSTLVTPNYDALYKRAAQYFRARLARTNTLDVTAVYWGQNTGLHVARIIGRKYGRSIQVDVPIPLDDLKDNLPAYIEPIQIKIAQLFEEKGNG